MSVSASMTTISSRCVSGLSGADASRRHENGSEERCPRSAAMTCDALTTANWRAKSSLRRSGWECSVMNGLDGTSRICWPTL